MEKIIYADFRKRITPSQKRKEDDLATMVRVRTPKGFDYVKRSMLPFLVDKGHVISEA